MNKIILIDENGVERDIADSKISIKCSGGNEIKIHAPYNIKGGLSIECGSNCQVVIRKGLIVYGKLNIRLRNKNSVYIGENVHLHSVSIFNWTEPGLVVNIGNNCLISSEVSLRTSDGHSIFLEIDKSRAINVPKYGIQIGDHVWIGSKVDILKDVVVGNNCIIGTRSLVTSGIYTNNSVVAGVPAKSIKFGVNWSAENTYQYNIINKK